MKTEFCDPMDDLLLFVSQVKRYATEHDLSQISKILSEAPTNFGIPPTEDYAKIYELLSKLPSSQVPKLPADVQSTIIQLKIKILEILP